MRVPVCMYACVYIGEKQIFLLSSHYFELTHKNLQNNSFQLLKGKHKLFTNTGHQHSCLAESYYT